MVAGGRGRDRTPLSSAKLPQLLGTGRVLSGIRRTKWTCDSVRVSADSPHGCLHQVEELEVPEGREEERPQAGLRPHNACIHAEGLRQLGSDVHSEGSRK